MCNIIITIQKSYLISDTDNIPGHNISDNFMSGWLTEDAWGFPSVQSENITAFLEVW